MVLEGIPIVFGTNETITSISLWRYAVYPLRLRIFGQWQRILEYAPNAVYSTSAIIVQVSIRRIFIRVGRISLA